jgi:hypothetical protein
VGKQNRFDLGCRTPETGFSRAPLVNEGPGPKRERDFLHQREYTEASRLKASMKAEG